MTIMKPRIERIKRILSRASLLRGAGRPRKELIPFRVFKLSCFRGYLFFLLKEICVICGELL
jgi:hypothetical protein